MTTLELLTALEGSPAAQAISKSNHLVGAGLQVVHRSADNNHIFPPT